VALALGVPGASLALGGSTLTIEVRPAGSGRVIGPGIDCDDKCSYEIEEPVTLTAIPNPGYTFKGWKGCDTGGVSGRKCTVMSSEQSIAALFVRTPALTASKAKGTGAGKLTSLYGVSCAAGCTSTTVYFLEGTKVAVKQVPAKHSHFVEWLGDCTGSGSCELTMEKDHDVEALFAADPRHTLTLTKAGDGQGSVKSKPVGIVCLYTCTTVDASFYEGETVVLEAAPGKGSTFEGWSGCDSEPEGKCEVTMDAPASVTATFG